MGLAAVPFGTAQAEDYEIEAHADDEHLFVSACFRESTEPLEDRSRQLQFCGSFGGEYEKLYAGGLPKRVDGQWFVVRGYHDAGGGKVVVTDTKFSEGKKVTRKDVEEQWQKEIDLIRGWWKDITWGKTFTVDCKMYDLPKGCQVLHCVLLRRRVLNLFLVRDKQRSFGGSEWMLVVVVPNDCGHMLVNSHIPTVVCGGEVKQLVSGNEILDPSVRSRILSALGQKDLSVKNSAVVRQCETDKPGVLLKDCSFVQHAKAIGQVRFGCKENYSTVGIWRRFPRGRFCLDPDVMRRAKDSSGFFRFARYAEQALYKVYAEEQGFSAFFHRGAKHNVVRRIKDWAEDIKDELEKVSEEGRLEK